MRGSEVRFYADLEDLSELFEAFKRGGAFSYTQTLSEVNKSLLKLDSAAGLMQYLRTNHPQPSNVFLVMDEESEVNTQNLTMSDGSGIKSKADQPLNPNGVLIKLGGQLNEQVLIATSINTTGETPIASEAFKLLKKITLKNAEHIGGFYVLPGAVKKLNSGWRLTPDPGFSRDLDLKVA